MFGNIKKNNIEFDIKANFNDGFEHLTIINGLYVKDGGTPVDYVMNKIVPIMRDKLKRKFKDIKPNDIKNKLKLYINIRFVKNLKFNSQTKEKVTNKISDFEEYFKDFDFEKIANKLLKDSDIYTLITEYFRLKEAAKEKAELKKLAKSVKKIKSESFYNSIGRNDYLIISEGDSALGMLQPALGRKNFAYYKLKGVPLNAWEVSIQKLSSNKELSELYQILKNNDFKQVVIASDKDADGAHIAGLLVGFFVKFLPEYKEKIFILNTPILAKVQNSKLIKWYYEIDPNADANKYFKGYASWKKEWLQKVIEQDGLDKMIEKIEVDNENYLDEWLSKSKADVRKEHIANYVLDINKI